MDAMEAILSRRSIRRYTLQSVSEETIGDRQLETNKGYWVQDCSAATENLLIAAHAKGLGAVWLGIYPREERVADIQKLLGLPEHIVPLALVSIGYPAEAKPPSNRYDAARIHYNRWS